MNGGSGAQGTVWFTYEISGSISTQQPAVNPVFVHFVMSAAPSGGNLVVNPASWTRRAGAQPDTLVFQNEAVYVPVVLPYGVPYDVGTSLRATASVNGTVVVATVDFFNTAILKKVDIPLGASLSAASGVDYLKFGAPVRLPPALSLLGSGIVLLVRRRTRKTQAWGRTRLSDWQAWGRTRLSD